MIRLILLSGALVIAAFSCSSSEGSGSVTDNFDGAELSDVWVKKKFLPGAVEMQTENVRHGLRAAKITLRPGDQIEQEKGTLLERAEISEAPEYWSVEDSLYSYTFSIYLPKDFPIDSTRLVIAQWKQECAVESCTPDNPILAVRYVANTVSITLKGPEMKVIYETTENVLGKWLDFRFDVSFSRSNNGVIKAWMNNKKLVEYFGANAYPNAGGYPDNNLFYFKTGLYRDRMKSTMTIYIDEYSKRQLSRASQH